MIANTVTIAEKTGKQRSIVLRGAALPLQGATYSTEQKLLTKWYAGNPWEATQHVLGSMDPPSDWSGKWNTTRLVASPPSYYDGPGAGEQKVVYANELAELFWGDTGFIRTACLLVVTWATDDGRSIVREGRIGPGKFPYTRFDDVEWQMTFVWTGRGNGPPREVQFNGDDSVVANQQAASALNDLSNEIPGANGPATDDPSIPFSATNESLGQFEQVDPDFFDNMMSYSADAASYSSRLQSSYTTTIQTATSFETSSDSGLSASLLIGEMFKMAQQLGQVPFETQAQPGSSVGDLASIAAWSALVGYRNEVALEKSVALLIATKSTESALTANQKNKFGPNTLRKTLRAKQGDTFARLALNEYGDATLGGALARANGLPSYQIAPDVGSIVTFPVFNASDLSAP